MRFDPGQGWRRFHDDADALRAMLEAERAGLTAMPPHMWRYIDDLREAIREAARPALSTDARARASHRAQWSSRILVTMLGTENR
ncbi:hypothetical protein [Nonomuraea sp. NPDC050643]|uniref:hypothetical protein n=1 Tax=Nonomuraea sp. NPDC050643 TaxID=3155660 RepID=UPI0033DD1F73